jgi:dodecin
MTTYKVIELVGSSYTSWEDAAKQTVEAASKTLQDLRVAEVTRMDMRLEDGGRILFRIRLKLSFKVQSLEKFAEAFGAKPYAHEEE